MRNQDGCLVVMFIGTVAIIFLSIFGFNWYKAGLQQKVYSRQNIEITQWEVFMGIEPAERVIQVKE